jgi:D-alanine--poly(phosphoribitol) ligase subunit 2
MEVQKVMQEVQNFIRERFKVPENDPDFNEDVHLFDYGYIDSFGAVNLIAFVEEKFSIEITESDLVIHPLNTIREISNFVIKRKKGDL